MSKELLYIIIFIMSVFVASVSQILLKTSANKQYANKIQEYLNAKVIIAYALFFISTLITVIAYKYVPLSLGPALEATGYIFVSVLGYLILHEKISRQKLIGMAVIIVGILIVS